jgi:hypothetical protein
VTPKGLNGIYFLLNLYPRQNDFRKSYQCIKQESELGIVLRASGANLAHKRTIAVVDRDAASQVRESEGGYAISPVGSSDEPIESIVLYDWQERTITVGPSIWCETETDHNDPTDKWSGSYKVPVRPWAFLRLAVGVLFKHPDP